MTEPRTLEQWKAAHNRALMDLDVGFFAAQWPGLLVQSLLPAIHKARYECADIAPELRQDSRAWLREHGHTRIGGKAWPEGGGLP